MKLKKPATKFCEQKHAGETVAPLYIGPFLKGEPCKIELHPFSKVDLAKFNAPFLKGEFVQVELHPFSKVNLPRLNGTLFQRPPLAMDLR